MAFGQDRLVRLAAREHCPHGYKDEPDEAASCHTAVVDGYVVEGHVPIQAIASLLEERPDIVGLALPGMPADSPGMGGDEFTWATQPVVAVAFDGALAPFTY